MRVAIIDADLIGRKKHRFPNLACMKLSGYHKKLGDHVELLTDWQILGWDRVYVSKVFTDTEVPEEVLTAPSEIEKHAVAVARKHFGDEEAGIEGDVRSYL